MNPMNEAWNLLKFDTPPNYRPEGHLQSAPPASRGNDYQQPQMEQQRRSNTNNAGEQNHRLSTRPTPGRPHGEQTGVHTTDRQRQASRGAINPQIYDSKAERPWAGDPFPKPGESTRGTQEYRDYNRSTGEKERSDAFWGKMKQQPQMGASPHGNLTQQQQQAPKPPLQSPQYRQNL